MTENQSPQTAPGAAPGNSPDVKQPFVWLPIVGFCAIAAAVIAAAYYFLM